MEKFIPEMQLYYIVDNKRIQGSQYWSSEIVKTVMADSAALALLLEYPRAVGDKHVLEWVAKDAGLQIETTRYVEAVLKSEWKSESFEMRREHSDVKREL